jgi:hypothetical protein
MNSVIDCESIKVDMNNDFERELAFHNQALETVRISKHHLGLERRDESNSQDNVNVPMVKPKNYMDRIARNIENDRKQSKVRDELKKQRNKRSKTMRRRSEDSNRIRAKGKIRIKR